MIRRLRDLWDGDEDLRYAVTGFAKDLGTYLLALVTITAFWNLILRAVFPELPPFQCHGC